MLDKIIRFGVNLYNDYIYQKEQNFLARKQNFISITIPQSELDFIYICFPECNEEKSKVALSTRKVVAMLGEVEIDYIRAEMSFRDLDALDFWCNCGDVGFNTGLLAEELLKELCIESTNKIITSLEKVRDPDMNSTMKIYEFVSDLYQWYADTLK
jgi:hypothetical protein